MTDARRDEDHSERIVDELQRAQAEQRPVYINGGGSKRHLGGRDCTGDELDVSSHRGVVDYQPGELLITARSGTTSRYPAQVP